MRIDALPLMRIDALPLMRHFLSAAFLFIALPHAASLCLTLPHSAAPRCCLTLLPHSASLCCPTLQVYCCDMEIGRPQKLPYDPNSDDFDAQVGDSKDLYVSTADGSQFEATRWTDKQFPQIKSSVQRMFSDCFSLQDEPENSPLYSGALQPQSVPHCGLTVDSLSRSHLKDRRNSRPRFIFMLILCLALTLKSWYCSHYSALGIVLTTQLLALFSLLSSWYCSHYSALGIVLTTQLLALFSLLSSWRCSHYSALGIVLTTQLLALFSLLSSCLSWLDSSVGISGPCHVWCPCVPCLLRLRVSDISPLMLGLFSTPTLVKARAKAPQVSKETHSESKQTLAVAQLMVLWQHAVVLWHLVACSGAVQWCCGI